MKNTLDQLAALKQQLIAEGQVAQEIDDVTPPKRLSKKATRQHLDQILAGQQQGSTTSTFLREDAPATVERFAHVLGEGVRPLSHDNDARLQLYAEQRQRVITQSQVVRQQSAMQNHQHVAVPLSDHEALIEPLHAESVLSYKEKTLPYRIFDQLKKGELRWMQAVDLHGCTIDEARDAVLRIIEMTMAEGHTVLKISHGKGESALLKSYINSWLKQHEQVLAFHSAPAQHGGGGAVLVLIKRVLVQPKK